jgi:hypothetical protein
MQRFHPDDVKTLVAAITENAQRLGLTWTLRPGTIVNGNDPSAIKVKIDGDTVATFVNSLIGVLLKDQRVYLMTIPSVGTYVVGWASGLAVGPRRVTNGTTRRESASAGFTAETVIDSVTPNLITGLTYDIKWNGVVQSTVADGIARMRIREDSLSGTQLQLRQQSTAIAASQSFPVSGLETEYTAVETGPKTFVVTGIRQTGTGTLSCFAAADTPTLLTVEYANG